MSSGYDIMISTYFLQFDTPFVSSSVCACPSLDCRSFKCHQALLQNNFRIVLSNYFLYLFHSQLCKVLHLQYHCSQYKCAPSFNLPVGENNKFYFICVLRLSCYLAKFRLKMLCFLNKSSKWV